MQTFLQITGKVLAYSMIVVCLAALLFVIILSLFPTKPNLAKIIEMDSEMDSEMETEFDYNQNHYHS